MFSPFVRVGDVKTEKDIAREKQLEEMAATFQAQMNASILRLATLKCDVMNRRRADEVKKSLVEVQIGS